MIPVNSLFLRAGQAFPAVPEHSLCPLVEWNTVLGLKAWFSALQRGFKVPPLYWEQLI